MTKKEKNDDGIKKTENDNPNGKTSDDPTDPQKEWEAPSNKQNIEYPQYINLRDLYLRFLTEWKTRIQTHLLIIVLWIVLIFTINFIYLFTLLNINLSENRILTIILLIAYVAFFIFFKNALTNELKNINETNELFIKQEKEITEVSFKIENLNEDIIYQELKNKCITTSQYLKNGETAKIYLSTLQALLAVIANSPIMQLVINATNMK